MKPLAGMDKWMPKINMNQDHQMWATMVSEETEMPPEDEGYISYVELRQNAIEFIKKRHIITVFTPKATKDIELVREIQYAWIKWFFNLTEKDLK